MRTGCCSCFAVNLYSSLHKGYIFFYQRQANACARQVLIALRQPLVKSFEYKGAGANRGCPALNQPAIVNRKGNPDCGSNGQICPRHIEDVSCIACRPVNFMAFEIRL